MMKRYVNYTGDSAITHYEIGDDFIRVKFNKELLEYNTSNNSSIDIEEMKVLANSGAGLYRYIMKKKIKSVESVKKLGVYQRLKSMFSFA